MKNKIRIALLSAGVAVATASYAHAATFTFLDDSVASGSVNTDTGVVVINNLITGTTNAGQEISGLNIFFSTTPAAAPTLVSQTGQLIDFGKFAPPVSTSFGTFEPVSNQPTHWSVGQSGSTEFTLTALGGGQPANMIIGPGTGGTATTENYPFINASVSNFSPSIFETGTFTITGLLGLTITGVQLEFGTGPDSASSILACVGDTCDLVPGQQSGGETPLPAALPLFAAGLGALGMLARRRKRKQIAI